MGSRAEACRTGGDVIAMAYSKLCDRCGRLIREAKHDVCSSTSKIIMHFDAPASGREYTMRLGAEPSDHRKTP